MRAEALNVWREAAAVELSRMARSRQTAHSHGRRLGRWECDRGAQRVHNLESAGPRRAVRLEDAEVLTAPPVVREGINGLVHALDGGAEAAGTRFSAEDGR